jgi:hypothetical protein
MNDKVELNDDELFVWHLAKLCALLAEGKPYISKEIAECFTTPKLGLQYGPKETMQRYAKRLLMQAAYDYKLRTELGGIDPKKAS